MIERDVFHIRLKDIEIQTERIVDPSLNTKAIAIISSPHPNGSIIFLSREAEEEGLSLGMKVSLAKKMSYSAKLLPYNHSLYNHIHRYIYRTVSLFTPIIEPQGIGQFFLDMCGMQAIRGDMNNTGLFIVNRIKEQTNLSGIVGISVNKLISSIITTVAPGHVHKVETGKEKQFLSPLQSMVLPTAQEKSVRYLLNFLMIRSVSQIQSMAEEIDAFRTIFGRHSSALYEESKGYDTSPVKQANLREHIVEQTILPNDSNNIITLNAIVKDLAEKVACKLRNRKQLAKKIRLDIYYTDGYKKQRIGTVEKTDDRSVTNILQQLLFKANKRRNRIRSILVDVWGFYPYAEQHDLFFTTDKRSMDLSKAVERLRKKYGNKILQTVDIFKALRNK